MTYRHRTLWDSGVRSAAVFSPSRITLASGQSSVKGRKHHHQTINRQVSCGQSAVHKHLSGTPYHALSHCDNEILAHSPAIVKLHVTVLTCWKMIPAQMCSHGEYRSRWLVWLVHLPALAVPQAPSFPFRHPGVIRAEIASFRAALIGAACGRNPVKRIKLG